MRAVRFHEHGDPSVLELDTVRLPEPERGEVRIRIHAASVNPFDTYLRAGTIEPLTDLPHVPGSDAAGVVESVGDGVSSVSSGDRVYTTGLGFDRPGTHAEYTVVPADRVAILPRGVSFESAAAAAEPITTALQALLHRGNLSLGEVCLVQGASGGVGHVAAQIARRAGATVIGTARAGSPTEFVAELGVDGVVDYRRDDLADAIRSVTGGRAVDLVLETHADANVDADLAVLARGGRIVVLGESATIVIDPETAATAKMADADLRFTSHMASSHHHGELLERGARLLAEGDVIPEVAETYSLSEAAAAQERCRESGVLGKIVLDVTATDD